ncbi:MAG TPA: hypothetical protein DD670_12250 [Planctomycetaceae bacterium]|nr:hypothetical protein [Planctomycetaceae bacterium]
MTMVFDPSGDFAQVADFQQEATLERPGTSDSWPLCRAVASPIRASEARSSAGAYTQDDVVWNLDAGELPATPQPGDVVVDSDLRCWVVLAARRGATGRWRCICRNLAIVQSLDQAIDVEVAVRSKDAAGAEVVSWQPWRTGVAARVQPIRSTVANIHQRLGQVSEWKVFVADQLDIDHTHRIKTSDGAVYRVVGVQKAQRIDALMEIDVIRAVEE